MTDNKLVLLLLKCAEELGRRAGVVPSKGKKEKVAKVKATKSKGGKTWILGKTRGRVPQFVLDAAKAKNKQELNENYVQGSKFVEGGPLPQKI